MSRDLPGATSRLLTSWQSMSLQHQIQQPLESENREDGDCEDNDGTDDEHGALTSGKTPPLPRTSTSGVEFSRARDRLVCFHESPALRIRSRTPTYGRASALTRPT